MDSSAAVHPQPSSSRGYEEALRACVAGADLSASAFVAACSHYKRATVALPFPSENFSCAASSSATAKEKDFDAVLAAAEALPPLRSLLSQPTASTSAPSNAHAAHHALPEASHALLAWLLAPTSRRAPALRHISMQQLLSQLQSTGGPGFRLDIATGATPSYVFENLQCTSMDAFKDPVVAYHGTSFERLHSIISTGLQPASGTRLERNGAIFGGGIYLSTDYGVAFSFCNPATGWRQSALGWKLRAMLVCQVEGASATVIDESNDSDTIPQHYVIVQRPDAVRITHVLVYCDERVAPPRPGGAGGATPARQAVAGTGAVAHAHARRVDWCMVVVVAYAAAMVLQAVLQNREFRRWLGLGR